MKRVFPIIVAAVMAVSCLDNSLYYESFQVDVNFSGFRETNAFSSDDQEYIANSFYCGALNFYCQTDTSKTFTGGSVIARLADSTLVTRKDTLTHFTVYGKPVARDSIANANIYIVYYDNPDTAMNPICAISYAYAALGTLKLTSIDVNNTVEGVASVLGYAGKAPLAKGGWVKVTFTGYLDDAVTGTVSQYLTDYTGLERKILTDWTTVDLSSLGTVDCLRIHVTSSDGLRPRYVCLDNVQGSGTIGSQN